MTNYLALDVGTVRIGVALANDIARIAAPLPAVMNDAAVHQALQTVVTNNDCSQIVVGLPRGLEGQDTEQTRYVKQFSEQLAAALQLPLHLQDEAVTSITAEAELAKRGKPFGKGDIDSLSAVYILEDYLGVH